MLKIQKIVFLIVLGLWSCQHNTTPVPSETLTPAASVHISTDEIRFNPFITGTVVDTEGQPIKDAIIMIKSKVILPVIDPDKLFQFSVKTNAAGEYAISHPEGVSEFILSASKPGYITVNELIQPEQTQVFHFGGAAQSAFPALEKAPEDQPTTNRDAEPYLTGTVLDAQGQPAAQATVTLLSTEIVPTLDPVKLFEFSVKTNASGEYRIPYPAVLSEFMLSASKDAYITVSQIVKPDPAAVFNFGGASMNSFPALSFCQHHCPSN